MVEYALLEDDDPAPAAPGSFRDRLATGVSGGGQERQDQLYIRSKKANVKVDEERYSLQNMLVLGAFSLFIGVLVGWGVGFAVGRDHCSGDDSPTPCEPNTTAGILRKGVPVWSRVCRGPGL